MPCCQAPGHCGSAPGTAPRRSVSALCLLRPHDLTQPESLFLQLPSFPAPETRPAAVFVFGGFLISLHFMIGRRKPEILSNGHGRTHMPYVKLAQRHHVRDPSVSLWLPAEADNEKHSPCSVAGTLSRREAGTHGLRGLEYPLRRHLSCACSSFCALKSISIKEASPLCSSGYPSLQPIIILLRYSSRR